MVHKIQIIKEYETDDLVNILADAMMACSYWCSELDYERSEYKEAKENLLDEGMAEGNICFEEVLVGMLESGKSLYFIDAEDADEMYELTLEKLLKGIRLNAEQRPHDCDLENGDAITMDCIIQFALFDDVIFA